MPIKSYFGGSLFKKMPIKSRFGCIFSKISIKSHFGHFFAKRCQKDEKMIKRQFPNQGLSDQAMRLH